MAVAFVGGGDEDLGEVLAADPVGAADGADLDEVGAGAVVAEGDDVVAEGGGLAGDFEVLHDGEVVFGEVDNGPAAAGDEDEEVGGLGVAVVGGAGDGLGVDGEGDGGGEEGFGDEGGGELGVAIVAAGELHVGGAAGEEGVDLGGGFAGGVEVGGGGLGEGLGFGGGRERGAFGDGGLLFGDWGGFFGGGLGEDGGTGFGFGDGFAERGLEGLFGWGRGLGHIILVWELMASVVGLGGICRCFLVGKRHENP